MVSFIDNLPSRDSPRIFLLPQTYSRDVLKCFTTLLSRFPTGFRFFVFIHYSHFVFGSNFTRFYKKIIRMMPINTALTCLICFIEGFGGPTAGSPWTQMLCFPFERPAYAAFTVNHQQNKQKPVPVPITTTQEKCAEHFLRRRLCLVLQKPALPHLTFD